MPKPLRAEQPITHYQIQTYGGNTLMPADAWVWVKIGDKAAKKMVADLKPNERVLETNTRVKASLTEIKQALLQDSLEYRLAHGQLHVTPEGETEPTPKLQAFLRAVLEEKGFSEEDLKQVKMRQQAVKIIKDRLEGMNERLEGRYPGQKLGLDRAESTIDQWLSGKIVMPSDFMVLRLLRRLNPKKFGEFFGDSNQLTPKEGEQLNAYPLPWAHHYWANTHRILTHWIGGFSQKALDSENVAFEIPERDEQQEGGKKTRNQVDVDEERRIVYDKLIKPIWEQVDRQHAFTRIKKLLPITRKEAIAVMRKGPVLPKGVVKAEKKKPEELGVGTTDYSELYQQDRLLRHVAAAMLDNLELPSGLIVMENAISGKPVKIEGNRGLGKIVLVALDSESAGDPQRSNEELQHFIHGDNKVLFTKERLAKLGEFAKNALISGDADKAAGFHPGTIAKILERSEEVQKNIPLKEDIAASIDLETEIFEQIIEIGKTDSAKERQEKMKPVRKLAGYYNTVLNRLRRYGIPQENRFTGKTGKEYIDIKQGAGMETIKYMPKPETKQLTSALSGTDLDETEVRKIREKYHDLFRD